MKGFIRIIILGVFFSIISVLTFSEPVVGLQKGNLFPEITLRTHDGKTTVTSKQLQGKVTIYSFGATWCTFCKEERVILSKFYDENKSKVNVVSIINESSNQKMRTFLKDNPASFQTFQDKNGAIHRQFFVRATPSTYVVDEKGIILGRVSGMLPWNEITFEDLIGTD